MAKEKLEINQTKIWELRNIVNFAVDFSGPQEDELRI